MAKQLQLRKGTSAEHNTFTGAVGEVTVDTTNKTLRVHDGSTVGGTRLATLTEDSVPAAQLPAATPPTIRVVVPLLLSPTTVTEIRIGLPVLLVYVVPNALDAVTS